MKSIRHLRAFSHEPLWAVALLLIPVMQAGSAGEATRISPEERQALVALYEATGGGAWVHRDGWVGPVGSECRWYGVVCGREIGEAAAGKLTVTDLDLGHNGLTRRAPPEVGALKGLKRLMLGGNAVTGPLPEALLQKFDQAQLEIEPFSLIHDVEEVLVDVNNAALLCSGYRARISADGTVRLQRKRCREHSRRQTRRVYCEFQQGKTYAFGELARFLIRSGFFADTESPVVNRWLDVAETTLTAKRAGGVRVHRSWSRPVSISDWSLETILDDIIVRTQWAAPPKEIPCSSQ